MGPREIKIYGFTVKSNDFWKRRKAMLKEVSNVTYYATRNLLCLPVNFICKFQQSSNAETKGKESLNTKLHDEFSRQIVSYLGEAIISLTLPNAVTNLQISAE